MWKKNETLWLTRGPKNTRFKIPGFLHNGSLFGVLYMKEKPRDFSFFEKWLNRNVEYQG